MKYSAEPGGPVAHACSRQRAEVSCDAGDRRGGEFVLAGELAVNRAVGDARRLGKRIDADPTDLPRLRISRAAVLTRRARFFCCCFFVTRIDRLISP